MKEALSCAFAITSAAHGSARHAVVRVALSRLSSTDWPKSVPAGRV